MKLIAILACLISTSVFADAIERNYQGQIFKKENLRNCEVEYDRITTFLNSMDGFTVLDGMCFEYGAERVRLSFKYIAPVAKNLESFKYEFSSNETCLEKIKIAEMGMQAAGNIVVASYCNGRGYKLDYIDQNYTVVKNLNLNATFSDKETCLKEKKQINKAFLAHKMSSLVSFCRPFKNMKDEMFFSLNAIYVARYDRDMGVVKGMTVTSECLAQSATIEQNFKDAEVVLAYKFCSEREYLLYIDDSNYYSSKVKEYKGSRYSDEATCLMQKRNLINTFSDLKRKTVYSYCQSTNDKSYTPYVHYVQMK